MKKYILSFLLGIGVAVLIGASSSLNLIIARPDEPSYVMVFVDAYSNQAKAHIEEYHKKGYIVKAISNGGDGAMIITVMEKYGN